MAEALAALKEAGSYADDNPTLPDPAPFVGAASCAECHAEKFQAQQGSRHARTFLRVSQIHDLALPPPSFPDPADAKVTHTLRQTGPFRPGNLHPTLDNVVFVGSGTQPGS